MLFYVPTMFNIIVADEPVNFYSHQYCSTGIEPTVLQFVVWIYLAKYFMKSNRHDELRCQVSQSIK